MNAQTSITLYKLFLIECLWQLNCFVGIRIELFDYYQTISTKNGGSENFLECIFYFLSKCLSLPGTKLTIAPEGLKAKALLKNRT